MKVLVTGANGFVGKNLVSTLKNIKEGKDRTRNIDIEDIYTYDIDNMVEDLKEYTKECDFVFHLLTFEIDRLFFINQPTVEFIHFAFE